MKLQFYDTIETLPLYNFDKYRNTSDMNWFVIGFDGRQKKLSIEVLQPIEKLVLEEYFKAIDDRSFTNKLQKLAQIEVLKLKYNAVKSLLNRMWDGFSDDQMETRYLFVEELAKHGFKMAKINTIAGDKEELLRLNAGCEGIKTKIAIIEKEILKDEKVVSTSLTKQLLIAQVGLPELGEINPKKTAVLRWIEITKLLEEKSKQN